MTDDGREISAQVLERHGRFLHALALSLVGGDEHLADDLVQEAALRAHCRPPAKAAALGGWLARVVRNLACDLGRQAGRRRAREEAVARSESPADPARVAARQEVLARVLAAVRELPEPYRSTIHHRFYDDLSLPRIAQLQGVPRETVKARLRRGLGRLRERLDADHQGDRMAWSTALITCLEAHGGALPGAAAPVTAGVVGVMLLMKWKAMVAAGLLLAVLATVAVWQPWSVEAGGVAPAVPGPVAARVGAEPGGEVIASDGNEEDGPRRQALAAQEGQSAGIRVRVTWREDGEPAVGIPVQLEKRAVWLAGQPKPKVPGFPVVFTDANGTVDFPRLGDGIYDVGTLRGNARRNNLRFRHDKPELVELTLARHTTATGLVTDEAGNPVVGAAVHLGMVPDPLDPYVVAATDSQGRFAVYGLAEHNVLYARAPGHGTSQLEFPGLDLHLVLSSRHGSLALAVLDGAGRPVSDARVSLCTDVDERPLPDGRHIARVPELHGRTGSEGVLSLGGIPPGKWRVTLTAAGLAPWMDEALIEQGGTTRRRISMNRGGEVWGVVTGADGRPIKWALVSWRARYWVSFAHTHTDEQGRYRLSHLAVGKRMIEVECVAGHKREYVQLQEDEKKRLDFRFDRLASLTGRILDSRQRPISGLKMTMSPMSRADVACVGWWCRDVTDREGRFTFPHCPDIRFVLQVETRNSRYPTLVKENLTLADFPLTLVMPEGYDSLGGIKCRLVDGRGKPLATVVKLTQWQARDLVAVPRISYGKKVAGNGLFEIDCLPGGNYVLAVSSVPYIRYQFGVLKVKAGEVLDLGDLVFDPPGSLRVSVDPPGEYTFQLDREEAGQRLNLTIDRNTPPILTGFQPGTYTLRVTGRAAPLFTSVTILPNKVVDLALTMKPAVKVSLLFTGRLEEITREHRLVLTDDQGRTIEATTIYGGASRPFKHTRWLGLGTYKVVLTTHNGHRAGGTFTVDSLDRMKPVVIPFQE